MSDCNLLADEEFGVKDKQELIKKCEEKGLLVMPLSFHSPTACQC